MVQLPRIFLAFLALSCVLPGAASAAVDVTRDAASGAIRITGDASSDVVSMTRVGAELHVGVSAGAAVTSSDDSCAMATASAICAAATGAAVTVDLGDGADSLVADGATSIALTASGGAGADTLRVGASGTTIITDTTATDTIKLEHADSSLRVRYETASQRLVARCSGCATPWAVRLPRQPGTVVLGAEADDVDLTTWLALGRTSWQLGDGRDRFFGSPRHRSIADGGADHDTLVSRAPADTLRGGAGNDKIGDTGGSGDVLQGGPDIDSFTSLDSRSDIIDGQGGRDLCLSAGRGVRTCDTTVRNVETAQYSPVPAFAFQALGIR